MSLSVVVITTMMTGIIVIIADITGMEIIARRHLLPRIGDLTGRIVRLRACARHLSDQDRACRPRHLMVAPVVRTDISPVVGREPIFRLGGQVGQDSRRLMVGQADLVVVFPVGIFPAVDLEPTSRPVVAPVDRQCRRLMAGLVDLAAVSPVEAFLVEDLAEVALAEAFPVVDLAVRAKFIRYVDYTGRLDSKRPVFC